MADTITADLIRELHEADYQHPAVISVHQTEGFRVEAEPTAQSYGRRVVCYQGQVIDWANDQVMTPADYEQFAAELQVEVEAWRGDDE